MLAPKRKKSLYLNRLHQPLSHVGSNAAKARGLRTSSLLQRSSRLLRLRPGKRDHDGCDDVVDARAAREIAQGARESLQHGADRLRAPEMLRQLVRDVARTEIGENEHVRTP